MIVIALRFHSMSVLWNVQPDCNLVRPPLTKERLYLSYWMQLSYVTSNVSHHLFAFECLVYIHCFASVTIHLYDSNQSIGLDSSNALWKVHSDSSLVCSGHQAIANPVIEDATNLCHHVIELPVGGALAIVAFWTHLLVRRAH